MELNERISVATRPLVGQIQNGGHKEEEGGQGEGGGREQGLLICITMPIAPSAVPPLSWQRRHSKWPSSGILIFQNPTLFEDPKRSIEIPPEERRS